MEKKFERRDSNVSFFKRERGTTSSREERGSREDSSAGRRDDSSERSERRSFNPNFSADNRVRGGQNREGGFQRREGGSSFERRDNNREGGFQRREGGSSERREGGFQRREGGSSFERRDNNREGGFQRREGGSSERREGGFQRREGGSSFERRDNNREGGFQRREGGSSERREGGFQRREGGSSFERRDNNREGGFQRREGGSSERREGGFQRREGGSSFERRDNNREGGFQRREGGSSERREGGFQRREGGSREGGFQRREGGSSFERRDNNREGGFQRREGGSSERREGGFQRREGGNREGGFQRREGGFQKRSSAPEAGFRRRDGGFQRRDENSASEPREYKASAPQNSRFDGKYEEYELQEQFNVEAELLKGDIRLNRYVSMSGICSRREADTIISEGRVTVNGEIVKELGSKVTVSDVVTVDGKLIKGEKNVYILMNKPKDFVTTLDDPNATHIVTELLGDYVTERVYPVGRLDKNSVGVLIMTNDGELTKILTHPSYNKKKVYHVFLDKDITDEDMEKIASGIELEDGMAFADEISCVEGNRREIGVEIHSGRNRIVRRMFEHLGYKVRKLDRVMFAGLTKKNLKRGEWRYLTPEEVALLKSGLPQ